jgi:hypothetical protein
MCARWKASLAFILLLICTGFELRPDHMEAMMGQILRRVTNSPSTKALQMILEVSGFSQF